MLLRHAATNGFIGFFHQLAISGDWSSDTKFDSIDHVSLGPPSTTDTVVIRALNQMTLALRNPNASHKMILWKCGRIMHDADAKYDSYAVDLI